MFLTFPGNKVLVTLFVLSLILFLVSIALTLRIFPDVIEDQVNRNVRLEQHTEQYDRFLELPFPVDFKVYIFNVTNAKDITTDTKPILQEIGPYVYKQYRKKDVKTTDDEEDTVDYRQTEIFEFDPVASGNLKDDDEVIVVNAPLLSVLQIAENSGLVGVIADCFLKALGEYKDVFIKVKVKDLLFEGIPFCGPNTDILCLAPNVVACNIARAKKNVHSDSKDQLLFFSMFHYKNATDDGLYTVKRGITDIHSLGKIVKLDNSTHTKFWGDENSTTTCDEVKGTDSTLYPPRVTKDSVFQIYSTDICRYVEINYVEERIYKGIDGYLFSVDNTTLRNSTDPITGDCFCGNQTRGLDGLQTCFLDGVIDMNPCIGVPVLLSFPHFLWADERYLKDVVGLKPDPNLHRTYLNVEPNTGIPLEGVKRIQINAVLRPIEKASYMEKIPRVVVPLLWIEEGVHLTDEYIDKLKSMYFQKVQLVNIFQWCFMGVSLSATILIGIVFVWKQCKVNLGEV